MTGLWDWLKALLLALFGRRTETALLDHYDHIIEDLTLRLELCEERCSQCEKNHDASQEALGKTQIEMLALRNLVERIEQQGLVAQITCDQRGVITEWNPAATTLFQFTREESLGKDISTLTPHRYKRLHLLAFRKLTESKAEPRKEPLKVHAVTRNGLEVPVLVELNAWEIDGNWFYGASISRRAEG